MIDRRLFRDIPLAVLIALPAASFVRPPPADPTTQPRIEALATANSPVSDERIGLLG
jgi:hypothetical protein